MLENRRGEGEAQVNVENGDEDEEDRDHLPFESDFIFKVVARTLFGPAKLGLKHAARFAPVPLRFLAFLCAIVSWFLSVRMRLC